MRNSLKLLSALAVAAGMAACTADDDVETFEAEETAVPEYEAPAPPEETMASPILTADFEATDAEVGPDQVTGIARVYPLDRGLTERPAEPISPEGEVDEMGEPTTEPGLETDVTATAEGFLLEVTLDGLNQGEHAWHIHSGPCGEQAPVAVAITQTADSEGIGEPIDVMSEGASARASVEVPGDQLSLEQLRSGEYSVNIHQSGGVDHGPAVACADLNDDGIL